MNGADRSFDDLRRCPVAVNRKIKAEDALPGWKGRLLLFQPFFTSAGAGWAEAVSRRTRYSGSTLSCDFFFHSMVDAPPVRYGGEHFSLSDREKYIFQILGNAREIY
jgi:hypothetical protein